MSNYIQHMNNHIEKYPTTALLKFFITLKKNLMELINVKFQRKLT